MAYVISILIIILLVSVFVYRIRCKKSNNQGDMINISKNNSVSGTKTINIPKKEVLLLPMKVGSYDEKQTKNNETEMEIKTSLQTNSETVTQEEDIKLEEMPSCILLLFSEYLGYETPLIEWCEEWCTNPNFPAFKKSILDVDAFCMLSQMKKDYSIKTLHEFYDKFYDLAIKNWVEKLAENEKKYDNLPI